MLRALLKFGSKEPVNSARVSPLGYPVLLACLRLFFRGVVFFPRIAGRFKIIGHASGPVRARSTRLGLRPLMASFFAPSPIEANAHARGMLRLAIGEPRLSYRP